MNDLRLSIQGDKEAARLREVLAREGFRIVEPPRAGAPQPGALVLESDGAPPARGTAAQRIEELERLVLELRNLDVAKSQFLTNVSHELRTPLTAIVTYGEILRDGLLGELTARQSDAIESMIGACRQLLAMIEEILTYARTNAQAITLQTTEFPVEEVVEGVHGMNASLLERKHLNFDVRSEPGLPRVRADKDKVAHVLGNLIGNAIKFTDKGGVTLTVPKGSNTGKLLRLKGRGATVADSSKRGDLLVRLEIVLPDTPDAQLDAFAEQWRRERPYAPKRRT